MNNTRQRRPAADRAAATIRALAPMRSRNAQTPAQLDTANSANNDDDSNDGHFTMIDDNPTGDDAPCEHAGTDDDGQVVGDDDARQESAAGVDPRDDGSTSWLHTHNLHTLRTVTPPPALATNSRTRAPPPTPVTPASGTSRDTPAKRAAAHSNTNKLTARCNAARISSALKQPFPKPFDGSPSHDFDDFRRRFRQRATLCGLTDPEQVVVLLGCLAGAAADIYMQWMDDGDLEGLEMPTVIDRLRRQFPSSTVTDDNALLRFTQLAQGQDESVTQLAQRFRECLRGGPISAEDPVVRRQWIKAVQPTYKAILYQDFPNDDTTPTDFAALVQRTVRMEALIRQDSGHNGAIAANGDTARHDRRRDRLSDIASDDERSDGDDRRRQRGKRSAPVIHAIQAETRRDPPPQPKRQRQGEAEGSNASAWLSHMRAIQSANQTMATRLEATAERMRENLDKASRPDTRQPREQNGPPWRRQLPWNRWERREDNTNDRRYAGYDDRRRRYDDDRGERRNDPRDHREGGRRNEQYGDRRDGPRPDGRERRDDRMAPYRVPERGEERRPERTQPRALDRDDRAPAADVRAWHAQPHAMPPFFPPMWMPYPNMPFPFPYPTRPETPKATAPQIHAITDSAAPQPQVGMPHPN